MPGVDNSVLNITLLVLLGLAVALMYAFKKTASNYYIDDKVDSDVDIFGETSLEKEYYESLKKGYGPLYDDVKETEVSDEQQWKDLLNVRGSWYDGTRMTYEVFDQSGKRQDYINSNGDLIHFV